MANIVPFNESKLPAHVRAQGRNTDLMSGVGGISFPVISIEGKVFSKKVKGVEPELLCEPGTKVPARALQVVIMAAGPTGNKSSQVFYAGKYVKGSDAKPTCFSNDGVAPATGAAQPQSPKCATCAQNQWGSRITEDGKKAKACQASKRLAVAAPDQVNEPMLLRVPTTSLVTLAEYANYLDNRGVAYSAVVTEISFDWTKPHQVLTFKPVGFLDEETTAQVQQMLDSPTVGYITGTIDMPVVDTADAEPFETPKPAAKAKPAAPKVEPEDDDLPTTPPPKTVKVEEDPAPAKPAAKAKPAPAPVADEGDQSLDSALDALDFDDM